MGTYTLTQMRAEIGNHFANRSDLGNADFDLALNLGQTRIARAHDFEELRKVEDGTLPFVDTAATDRYFLFSALATTTNPREIYSFRIVSGDGSAAKLKYESTRKFDAEIPDPEFLSTGQPHRYTIWQNRFELYKIPDQAYPYTLRMTVWPTALTTASQTSDLREKDDALIMLAISWTWNRLGEYDRAARFFGIFKDMFKDAVAEDERKPDRDLAPSAGRAHAVVLTDQYWLNPFIDWVR